MIKAILAVNKTKAAFVVVVGVRSVTGGVYFSYEGEVRDSLTLSILL